MHARISFIQYTIILATFGALTACSDSSTPETPPIPLIETAAFPFVQDHTLYNFNPKTGLKEKLAESNKSFMISLDIDQSKSTTIEEGSTDTFLNHTSLPEYVVYVEDQALRLYDLFTRQDHVLTNFAAGDQQATDEFICDMRPVITADKEHLNKQIVLFKNEESVYLKTSSTEDCTGTPESFKYLEIKIEDSFTETFNIRRTSLLQHEHFHTHQHEHDYDHQNDHGGDHTHSHNEDIDGEGINDHPHDEHGHQIDPNYPDEAPHDHSHSDYTPDRLHSHQHGFNVKDRKLHEHKHEHIHDFNYIIMEEHNYNDDPATSPDAVHSLASNQITEVENHPVLVGKRHVIDSALMYAGNPIIDLNNKRFGYLGFNNSDPTSPDASYRFFETIVEGGEKLETWRMTNSEFSIQPNDYWGHIDHSFADAVMIEFNKKMVKWDLEELFDDDKQTERQASIDNPMFIRPLTDDDTYNRARYSINEEQSAIAIYETFQETVIDDITSEESIITNRHFYTVQEDQAQTLLRRIVDDSVEILNFVLFPTALVSFKEFTDETGYLGSSVTSTNFTNTTGQLEKTLNPISDLSFITFYPDNSLAITTQNESYPVLHSNYYNSIPEKRMALDLEHSIFSSISDHRPLADDEDSTESTPLLLISDSITSPYSDSSLTALFEPDMYLLDKTDLIWEENLLGTVPTTVSLAYDAKIHSDLFAQITIRELLTLPETYKTYYFNPDDPSTEMLLMYEEIFSE